MTELEQLLAKIAEMKETHTKYPPTSNKEKWWRLGRDDVIFEIEYLIEQIQKGEALCSGDV